MNSLLLAGLGAGVGACLRYWVTNFGKKHWQYNWPLPTLFINLTGAFILGIIYALKVNTLAYALIGTGILGGYTTFSTMNVELLSLFNNGVRKPFWMYFICTYLGGLVLVFAGFYLGKVF